MSVAYSQQQQQQPPQQQHPPPMPQNQQQHRGLPPNRGPSGMPPPNTAHIQKILDENCGLIQTIQDFQNLGKVNECMSFHQALHRNLVYLAQLADSTQNIAQILPPPHVLQASVGQQMPPMHGSVPQQMPPHHPSDTGHPGPPNQQPSMSYNHHGQPPQHQGPHQPSHPTQHQAPHQPSHQIPHHSQPVHQSLHQSQHQPPHQGMHQPPHPGPVIGNH